MNKDVSDKCYADFTAFLQARSGIMLGDAKRYLVRSRLSTLMHTYGMEDINELILQVISGRQPLITDAAIDVMTTNETLWFRDGYPFDLLKSTVLPALSEQRKPIKVWSAACSSGQEPYSIAMTYKEYIDSQLYHGSPLSIVATDLSPSMINASKEGVYDELSLSRGGLTPKRRSRFFDTLVDGRLSVKQELKSMIEFKQNNLVEDRSTKGPFDIIFCRNVLIYFSNEVKLNILQHFAACLSPGGILFLGASESIGEANQYFNLVRCSPGLYYQRKS